MNWDQVEGQWKQVKGKIREQWGKLTDSDLDQIGGKKDKLLGMLQQRYGYQKEQAQAELDRYLSAKGEQEPGAASSAPGDKPLH